MSHSRTPSDENTDLKERIKQISDGLSRDRDTAHASKARDVAAAVGAETPATVLPDIRDVNNRMLSVMEGIYNMQMEAERNAAVRHKEMCTLLMGLMNSGASKPDVTTLHGPGSRSGGGEGYYYGSTALTSGTHVIACVLMHIDILVTEHPQFSRIQSTDSTFMDIKDWYVLSGYALNADKPSKAGLRIPKPSDEDFKSVCRVLAASAPGRRPRCQAPNLHALVSECPGIMNTVEWIRQALVRCKGILSPEREYRFRYIHHPFINEDMDMLIEQQTTRKLPNKSFHQSVSSMKSTQKKVYMNLVLEKDVAYMEAMSVASK